MPTSKLHPLSSSSPSYAELLERVRSLESEKSSWEEEKRSLESRMEHLRQAWLRASHELTLLKKRLFQAKAERVDSTQLELDFGAKQAELRRLAAELGMSEADAEPPSGGEGGPKGASPTGKTKPKGRRNLQESKLPVIREELLDPDFEALVAEGKAVRCGFEESSQLCRERGGMRRLVTARAVYKLTGAETEEGTTMITTALPRQLLRRCLAHSSLLAFIVTSKFLEGMPLFRLEARFQREGCPLDRGTMCRYAEELGAVLGATVVEAMYVDARLRAFCMATDATGVLVQPIADRAKGRQACRRGHFTVVIADQDHVFFSYSAKENSSTVAQLFHGFNGYVLADAHSVHDILFLPPEERKRRLAALGLEDDGGQRQEVGCWAHARRKFWDAFLLTRSDQAAEALYCIGKFYELDQVWNELPPAQRHALRLQHLRPQLLAFFAAADEAYATLRSQRSPLRAAFGYVVRQRKALLRFLDDGRLPMDNNRSERALRPIAVGRKNWLFIGSDDHGESAAALFTLSASARLHGLDPELYLDELIRVLPYWPRDRYLELSPLHWAATRARLLPAELERKAGPITVPPPSAPEQ